MFFSLSVSFCVDLAFSFVFLHFFYNFSGNKSCRIGGVFHESCIIGMKNVLNEGSF